ncbi:glycerol-3-phosphate responsive antiterminator [Salisediminibacterium halotolerans]|uniref:Glycerol uptake operon antiterminator regulatory protein n=1 Tax=Salisediminibacterium halotolerans TaxID=517425 RepID=A0A1H9TL77_9BACI|nr:MULTISPECIES: glycerol-3-phosphate responsive antiterminator [Salisediminibacterium]RLJ72342.1 glycerol uptake operon antiterminator [Actinophytocola xinjiangensis]RPE85556.1 glycerol uptake operon antiterminator [Salisediminibacterium halotolerans]TWG33511.1 glycerol uptake operon antiterminator [Salisediminibacterium halotolerans]SER97901.1 glycerol uptake operon antiterminator [Salisediminibacterium haloalkalitolerans]GEL08522.1 glycerol uptake operon antiterminator regulatory protein [S
MNGFGSEVIPAIRELKDLDKIVETDFQYVALLNMHIGQLRSVVKKLHQHEKKVLLHADLVQGLTSDEYAAQFLCRDIKPDGLISTRKNVLLTAKKAKILTIQRAFLLDSKALESSFHILETVQPDYIEVLPGVIPHIIQEIYEKANVPVIAGGLIRTDEEVASALTAGAVAVTTSRRELWKPDRLET